MSACLIDVNVFNPRSRPKTRRRSRSRGRIVSCVPHYFHGKTLVGLLIKNNSYNVFRASLHSSARFDIYIYIYIQYTYIYIVYIVYGYGHFFGSNHRQTFRLLVGRSVGRSVGLIGLY